MNRFTKGTTLFCLFCLLGFSSAFARANDPAQYEDIHRATVADDKQPMQKRIQACKRIGEIGPRAEAETRRTLAMAVMYKGPLGWYDPYLAFRGEPGGENYDGMRFRLAALGALQKVGADSQTVVPVLIKGLERIPSDYNRFPVGDSEFPGAAVPPMPSGPTPVNKRFNDFTIQIIKALASYGPKGRDGIDVLVKLVKKELSPPDDYPFPKEPNEAKHGDLFEFPWLHRNCRIAAIEALASMATSQDEKVVQALRRIDALEDNERLKEAAGKALDQIRSQ